MASFECKTLDVKVADSFCTVHLNCPEVRNAFNAELIADLHQFTKWANEEDSIRGVFLRGKGPIFCAGGDLNWMKESLHWDQKTNYEDSGKLSAMLTDLNQLSKPLIGFIHGGAYGGGVGLVSVCDHVVAEGSAVFSLSEVRLGLIPACIGPFVMDKVGISHCRSLFMSGTRFKSAKALAIGLIHDVVPDADGFNEVQNNLMKTLSACGPHAIQTAKSFLRQVKDLELPQANELAAKTLADLRVGKEAQEGIIAFLEKRKPKW